MFAGLNIVEKADKIVESKEERDFSKLDPDYIEKNLNRYNVIFISFNEIPRRCRSYEQYIDRIESILIEDLASAYPNVRIRQDDAVWDALKKIYVSDSRERFIFVLDEWDFIFHRDFVTERDKTAYIG